MKTLVTFVSNIVRSYMLTLLFFLVPITLSAQQEQVLNYDILGISINVPTGLTAQEGDEAIVMYSPNMQNTLFVLSTHDYSSLQELRTAAHEPYQEDNGTYLSKTGEVEAIGEDAVGAHFSGYAAGTEAEAYILGKINPFGSGVTVIGVTTNKTLETDILKEYVLKINHGILFSEPKVGGIVEEWTQKITNARLQYRSSYSSPSYTGGVSGYSSSTDTYDICGQGYFTYSGSSNVSMGSGDLSVLGGSNSSSRGNGTWKVEVDSEGNPYLQLTYHSGQVEAYSLDYDSGYLLLDGYKYTIGRGNEYGPNCY